MKPFWLYNLKCSDGSDYLGHTDDLEKRLDQHYEGVPGCYTFKRRPVELVYQCEFETREEALSRELQLKGWTRAKKEASPTPVLRLRARLRLALRSGRTVAQDHGCRPGSRSRTFTIMQLRTGG